MFGVQWILARIERNDSSLIDIDLRYEQINDTYACALAKALNTNTYVTTINLESNTISDIGAIALADCLHTNTTVVDINLSRNCIGNTGATALAQCLQNTNRTVSTIDIRYNKISTIGTIAFAEAIRYNSIVRHFHCTIDRDDEPGVYAIVQSLEQYNDTIIDMIITSSNSNNRIVQKHIQQIISIVQLNSVGERIAPEKMDKERCNTYKCLVEYWIHQSAQQLPPPVVNNVATNTAECEVVL